MYRNICIYTYIWNFCGLLYPTSSSLLKIKDAYTIITKQKTKTFEPIHNHFTETCFHLDSVTSQEHPSIS